MRRFSLALTLTILSIFAIAQAPNMFSYQAVARDNAGLAVANKLLKVRFSIIDLSSSGTVLYSEIHSPTTNLTGLFSLNVGAGTPETGSFAAIDWSSGAKFLKTEVDMTGQGTTYSLFGTTQLISVPYALYSEKSGNSGSPQIWTESGSTASYTGKVDIGDELHVKSFAYFDTTVASTYFKGGLIQVDRIFLPPNAGSGKILTSDVNGEATWQTPASGGSGPWKENGAEVYYDNGPVRIGANGTSYNNLTVNGVVYAADTLSSPYANIGLAYTNDIYTTGLLLYGGTSGKVLTSDNVGRANWQDLVVKTNQDIYITDATKGVIMKSANGKCWRMTISNTGTQVITNITCP